MTALMGSGASSLSPGKKTITTIRVPDARVDRLSEMFRPKKTTWSTVEMVLDDAAGTSLKILLDSIRNLDVLVTVVKAFEPEDIDLQRVMGDLDQIRDEMILADLMVVEKRLSSLRKTGSKEREATVLELMNARLEAGQFPCQNDFQPGDLAGLTHYNFLTLRPILAVVNVAESRLADPRWTDLLEQIARKGATPVLLSAGIESEIAQLPAEDQMAFLADLGISEPASHQLVRSIYRAMDLLSFFTVGEDEVRAWPVRAGALAPEAAGRIHSDLQRGFIRAETVTYDDLLTAGSIAAARRKGTLRLEGKDYLVQDGDILNILFKV